ncbi:MAG TPA: GntR family transcriptional regulator [Terriglobales bacterium]|nr:GntR family transcriptional regulator [Terriglobales bacterium]
MQLWFSHASGISLPEQLKTQIILGILSGDLAPGHRLPSTRDLARRYNLHPNTVSAGYRQLQKDRWVEFRHGSGVYVRDTRPESNSLLATDQLIADLLKSAHKLNVPLSEVRARIRQWLDAQPPDHFLLIEADEELRKILTAEIQQAVTFPVQSCSPQAASLTEAAKNAVAVALSNHARAAKQVLPAGVELQQLSTRSIPTSLAPWLPAPTGALVGTASRWPEFLKLAKTILTAAGFHADSLIFRDARKPDWHRGLKQATVVICDSITVQALPKGSLPIVFSLLSGVSVSELQRYQEFITASM